MKPNLLKPTDAKTMVLDKPEVEQKQQEASKEQVQTQNQVSQTNKPFVKEEEKQEVKIYSENKKSLFNAFNADAFVSEEKKKYITGETQNIAMLNIKKEVEDQVAPQEDFDWQNETLVSFKNKAKPKKSQWNFRFKLVTAVYVVVLGVMTGWITASAIRLANVQNSIHLSDIKYAQKLKDLEKLQEKQNQAENSNLIPWQELISVQPLPLEDVTEYEKQSNWFDNIINWFGNLFGG